MTCVCTSPSRDHVKGNKDVHGLPGARIKNKKIRSAPLSFLPVLPQVPMQVDRIGVERANKIADALPESCHVQCNNCCLSVVNRRAPSMCCLGKCLQNMEESSEARGFTRAHVAHVSNDNIAHERLIDSSGGPSRQRCGQARLGWLCWSYRF